MSKRKKKTKKNIDEKSVQKEESDVEKYIRLVSIVRRSKIQNDINLAYKEIEKMLGPRIKNLCNRFMISGMSPDDIYQEALIALRFKAIKDYDKTRGSGEGDAAFDRFAMLCIRRHLATELKTSYQMRRKVLNTSISLDQERNDSNDDLHLYNIIPQTKGNILNKLENKEYYGKLVNKLVSKLSKLEKEVFILYMEKYTYDEISDIIKKKNPKYKINIKGVDNALSRVKNKAQLVYKKYGDKNHNSHS